jgi:hypothetical protein
MSHRSSRVQGLPAHEDGDEVNQGNRDAQNVNPEIPRNGHLPPPRATAPIDLAAVLQQ